jgi:hypothetical protein
MDTTQVAEGQPPQPSTLEAMENARDYWFEQAMQLEGELDGFAQENNMLFDRAAKCLARIKELEAELIEVKTKAWVPVPDGNYDAQHFNHVFAIDRDCLKLSVPGLDGGAHDEVEIGLPDGIRLCKQAN